MAVFRAKVRSAREHTGMIWLHTRLGWISVSKAIFEEKFEDKIIKKVYSKHNALIERKIKKLEHEKHILRKEGKEREARLRAHEIHALQGQLKKELHMHELQGRRIVFKII